MNFISKINQHLEKINSIKDEFAYLSMTGKIENNIRDRLAFSLHQELNENYFILREWRKENSNDRTDIAILDKNEKVVCLIELKARAVPNIGNEFINLLKKDVEKMNLKRDENTEIISVVIFTNILKISKNTNFIKYFISKKFENSKIKIEADCKKIQNEVNLNLSKKIIIESGSFFENEIQNIIYTFNYDN